MQIFKKKTALLLRLYCHAIYDINVRQKPIRGIFCPHILNFKGMNVLNRLLWQLAHLCSSFMPGTKYKAGIIQNVLCNWSDVSSIFSHFCHSYQSINLLLFFSVRSDLCGWQQRQRACEWGARGADEDVGWGWAQGSSPARVCQQTGTNSFQLIMCTAFQLHVLTHLTRVCPTGPTERHERCRNHRQAGAAFAPAQELVHSGHMRHKRRRPLWRTRLVVQSTEKPEITTSLY